MQSMFHSFTISVYCYPTYSELLSSANPGRIVATQVVKQDQHSFQLPPVA